MSPRELNKKIRSLPKMVVKLDKTLNDPTLSKLKKEARSWSLEQNIKTEIHKCYHIVGGMEYWNLRSWKIMIRLNIRFRVIPLHQFGMKLKIEEL